MATKYYKKKEIQQRKGRENYQHLSEEEEKTESANIPIINTEGFSWKKPRKKSICTQSV